MCLCVRERQTSTWISCCHPLAQASSASCTDTGPWAPGCLAAASCDSRWQGGGRREKEKAGIDDRHIERKEKREEEGDGERERSDQKERERKICMCICTYKDNTLTKKKRERETIGHTQELRGIKTHKNVKQVEERYIEREELQVQ